MSENMDEKLLDLLCDKATVGLTPEEEKRLASFNNTSADAQELELAAAAVMLAEINLDEPMPAHLEARIIADANKHFAAQKSEDQIHEQPTQTFKWAPKPKRSFLDWFGWAVAAAACVALVGSVFYYQDKVSKLEALVKPTPTPIPEKLSPQQQRERLIAAVSDLTRAEWTKGNVKEAENIAGDVVWSDAKQAGYITLKGLPVNDANKDQYQLWIFDETQSEKTPIDGGVFNVTADGEVVIPIDAKLKARNPKAFAITIEQPGGVVVSTREKVAALAPVKPSQT